MNLATNITIARIILTPCCVGLIIYGRAELALLIFLAAVVSDGLDGFIARALDQQTALGRILDPVADKLLLMSVYITLSFVQTVPPHLRMPPYVPIVVISRDIIIVTGSVIVYLIKGDLSVSPSIIGKATTFFQMMAVVSILVQFRFSSVIWNAAVILTVASGLDYVVKGSRLLSENHAPVKRT